MSDPGSRYFNVPTAERSIPDGSGSERLVRYLQRRLLPPMDRLVTITEHRVGQGERLDNLSTRYLGDPLAWWRVADANLELQPERLTDEAGSRIRIAMPLP